MKIFITGATGFIGTHLVRRLASTEHKMVCMVRKTSKVNLFKEIELTLVEGDVTNKASILSAMKGCDWVVNLANIYSFWEPDRKIYRKVNVQGTRNVMECALENKISKVVHVSTLVVYGKPAECPFNENSPEGPVRFSEYARTKYEGDLIAWDMYKKQGLPLVVLYLASVLGMGDPKASGQFIKNLIQGKMPARVFENSIMTYVYVGDVVEAIMRALDKQDNIGEKYLIGKERISFGEATRMICEIAGVPMPKRVFPGPMTMTLAKVLTAFSRLSKRPPLWGMSIDQMCTIREGSQFDGSKAERELGIIYTPIRDAVAEAIQSYRQ